MSSEGKIDAELFGLWKKNLRNFFLRWDNNYSWPFSLTIEPAEKNGHFGSGLEVPNIAIPPETRFSGAGLYHGLQIARWIVHHVMNLV